MTSCVLVAAQSFYIRMGDVDSSNVVVDAYHASDLQIVHQLLYLNFTFKLLT